MNKLKLKLQAFLTRLILKKKKKPIDNDYMLISHYVALAKKNNLNLLINYDFEKGVVLSLSNEKIKQPRQRKTKKEGD